MKIFMLTLRWFKIKWSGRPGRHGRPGGPGGPVGHDQDSQGRLVGWSLWSGSGCSG